MLKALQLSVICEKLLTLSKEITYLELFNTFLITQAKSPKEIGHQSYVSENKLATRDTFLRLSWPVKSYMFVKLYTFIKCGHLFVVFFSFFGAPLPILLEK